jgi:hypothetical protein
MVDNNPLMNDFGSYVLSKLQTFQNMKSFRVHKDDKDLAEYVDHSTSIYYGTVAYRFSKELLATLETRGFLRLLLCQQPQRRWPHGQLLRDDPC